MLLPVITEMQIMQIYQSAVTHLNLQSGLWITKYHKPESAGRSPVRCLTQTVFFILVSMFTTITAFLSNVYQHRTFNVGLFLSCFHIKRSYFRKFQKCLNFDQKYCHRRFSHVFLVVDRRDILDNTKLLWSCIVFVYLC